MISVKNIRIRLNYVLVKPDEDFETYQIAGRETGLLAPSYAYQGDKRVAMPSKHFSVKGKVYGVPEKIQFNREAIKAINDNYTLVKKVGNQNQVVNGQLLRKISELKKESCRFETDNELSVGDTVKFSYMVHITAKENNVIFDTEEGKMYFIKYDDIFMTVDDNNKPLKMINGYILVDPDVVETKKENGMEYSEHTLPSGLQLVMPILATDSRQRKGAKCMEGKVLLAARPLTVFDELLDCQRAGGYFDIENYREIPIEVNSGDRILFDHRPSQQLEHDNHQAMADRKLYLIQRKDILLMEKDNKEVFSEIGMDKVNYDRV